MSGRILTTFILISADFRRIVSLNKDNNEEQEYNNSEIMCELFSFVAIVKKKFLKKIEIKIN
jgi:hypothetical protein